MKRLRRLLFQSRRFAIGLVKAYWALLRARQSKDVFEELIPSQTRARPQSHAVRLLTRRQRREVSEQVRLINIASRYPFRWALCLRRSQALLWRLRSLGVDAELRVGVRKEGSTMSAHAWVEYDGVVLNDRQDTTKLYTPLVRAGDVLQGAGSYRWDAT